LLFARSGEEGYERKDDRRALQPGGWRGAEGARGRPLMNSGRRGLRGGGRLVSSTRPTRKTHSAHDRLALDAEWARGSSLGVLRHVASRNNAGVYRERNYERNGAGDEKNRENGGRLGQIPNGGE
jgi:hypothetical protein